MKKKDLDIFTKILIDEKKKILRHLEELTESSEDELELGSGDAADIANIEINQSKIQKIGKRETYLLKKIELALSKIDDGTFGECENCGEQIGVPRLMARPVAQLCIDCKTEQENHEKRFSNKEEAEENDNYFEESEEPA